MEPTDTQKDIEEMFKVLDDPLGTADQATEPPGTEPPGTEPPGTEAPSTEQFSTEAPGTEAPGTEAPSTEVPPEDPRDAEIRKLREEMEELKKSRTTEAPSTEAPSTDAPLAIEDFLGEDVDLDEITRDPEALNKIFNKVLEKAVNIARADIRSSGENIMKSIPSVVKNTADLNRKLKEVNDKFYKDNADLKPFNKVVGAIFEEMLADSPDKTYEELLPDVAKETRKRLDLHKKATQNRDKPPPLEKNKRGKRQQPKPDTKGIQSELDEMDKVLGEL